MRHFKSYTAKRSRSKRFGNKPQKDTTNDKELEDILRYFKEMKFSYKSKKTGEEKEVALEEMLGRFQVFLAKNKKRVSLLENIAGYLADIKEGRPFTKVHAIFGIATLLADYIGRGEKIESIETIYKKFLKDQGYQVYQTNIPFFIYNTLQASDLPMEVRYAFDKEKENDSEDQEWCLHVWEKKGQGIAALMTDDGDLRDLYILGDEDTIREILYGIVWAEGKDLILTIKEEDRDVRDSITLRPLADPGPYVGTKGPKDYSARINRYNKKISRTLLLEGPSGIGKSVLARHIATDLSDGLGNTLKITGLSLLLSEPGEINDLISILQPSIFLIDDLEIDGSRATEEILALFEEISSDNKNRGGLTLITRMHTPPPIREPGGGWIEGLRPGRVDEVFTLNFPEKEDRDLILGYYCQKMAVDISPELKEKLVEGTEGLTGAYIKDLIYRLSVHGLEGWEDELESLLYMAPEPGSVPLGMRIGTNEARSTAE